ncbi:hypothetical protein [Streptomyces coelicoflavus]
MPFVPQDVLDRLTKLEREVRELRGRSQIRPALDQILNGNTTIGEGGALIVKDPGGASVFRTGIAVTGDYASAMSRVDGSVALSVGGNEGAGEGAPQMVRMWARSGEIIAGDDQYADGWLGRPWLPFPMYPTAVQGFENGDTWQLAWVGWGPAQNPVAVLKFASISSNGGQVRASYVAPDGTSRSLGTWSVPSGGTWINKTITQPLDGADWGDEVSLQIEHRNNTTSGLIETRVFSSYTREALTAEEVPNAA